MVGWGFRASYRWFFSARPASGRPTILEQIGKFGHRCAVDQIGAGWRQHPRKAMSAAGTAPFYLLPANQMFPVTSPKLKTTLSVATSISRSPVATFIMDKRAE